MAYIKLSIGDQMLFTKEEKLKSYLSSQLLINFEDNITEETDLFEEGLVDSFNFVKLISFIEGEFQVQVADDILVSDELSSVSSIAKWLEKQEKK